MIKHCLIMGPVVAVVMRNLVRHTYCEECPAAW
jgi:hypothetical protein